jgi:hypothetical protein
MQHPAPSLFINVFTIDGVDMPLESHGVAKSLAEAVKDAEDHADDYVYTLTDIGKMDLSPHFSESFHEKRDFDAAVDRHIDELRELKSFTMHGRP